MNRTPVLALFLLSLASTTAQADIASERVLLQTGTRWGCSTNETGFFRVHQNPDGTSWSNGVEFVVPSGTYLEITSIEYVTPAVTPWAFRGVQALDYIMRPRVGAGNAMVFSGRFQNRAVYASDGATLEETNEFVSPGANTHVASFPYGPLMGENARLCVNASRSFWQFGGTTRVRGRLVPTGLPPSSNAPTDVNWPR